MQDILNGTNLTAVDPNTVVEAGNVVTTLEKYTVPCICVFGLIGNSVSAYVFSRRQLRDNSSSLFLVARSISDNGFLATLLIIWASTLYDLHLGNIAGLCQVLIFFTYFFSCSSVWLVVLVTAENYVRICKPFVVRKVCKTANARASVIILFALVSIVYSFPLWTMREQCVPDRKYYDFIQVMTYIDSGLTLIAPSTVMAVLMSAIAVTTVSSCRRRRRLSTSTRSNVQSPLTKVTTMLLAVTLTFFVLNLPYHAVRLRLMILTFVEKQNLASRLSFELSLQSVSQMLYYFSLAINVVTYAIFSRKFRIVVKDLVLRTNKLDYPSSKHHIPVYPMRRGNLSLPELPANRITNNTLNVEESFPLRHSRSCNI